MESKITAANVGGLRQLAARTPASLISGVKPLSLAE